MAITKHNLPDAEDFARMESELFGKLERSHTRQVRRHRLVAAGALVLLASGGVASVTIANPQPISDAAYCYAAADAGSHSLQIERALTHESGESESPGAIMARRVAQAVSECEGAWQIGAVDPSSPAPTKVPRLQPCVRNDQVIAVFPKDSSESADDFCTNLGMSAP